MINRNKVMRAARILGLMRIINSASNCFWWLVKKYGRFAKKDEIGMIYSKKYFDIENSMTMPTAKEVVGILIEEFRPKSVADVGCGAGVYLREFQKKGIKIKGYDASRNAAKDAFIDRSFIELQDLTKELKASKKYDLVISFETGEHIPKRYSGIFVKNISKLGDIAAFSASQPGQGGRHHVNEQQPEFWIRIFGKNNFKYLPEKTERLRKKFKDIKCVWWLQKNVLVFKKRTLK